MPPLSDAAVFHCQQAAEKANKGFLTLHSTPFRKTHSIEDIGALAIAIDPSLRPVIDRAAPLTEYAWRFRYPGIPGEPALDEVDEAIAIAREVVTAVCAQVPVAARPWQTAVVRTRPPAVARCCTTIGAAVVLRRGTCPVGAPRSS